MHAKVGQGALGGVGWLEIARGRTGGATGMDSHACPGPSHGRSAAQEYHQRDSAASARQGLVGVQRKDCLLRPQSHGQVGQEDD